MYTDHQGTDQCALMISVAPAMPAVSVHQCQLSVLISATCQSPSVNTSMPHISAYRCTSMPHISAPISTSQCHLSMPSQCHLSVLPISATYQCQSVPPIRAANQCLLS
ncbi:unnamed protein product, partial [Staurois parvus]